MDVVDISTTTGNESAMVTDSAIVSAGSAGATGQFQLLWSQSSRGFSKAIF